MFKIWKRATPTTSADIRQHQNLYFRQLVNYDNVEDVRSVYICNTLNTKDARDCDNDALRCAARNQNLEMIKFLKHECGLNANDMLSCHNEWLESVWYTL